MRYNPHIATEMNRFREKELRQAAERARLTATAPRPHAVLTARQIVVATIVVLLPAGVVAMSVAG